MKLERCLVKCQIKKLQDRNSLLLERYTKCFPSAYRTHKDNLRLIPALQLWGTDHRPEHVEEACRKSLKDLQIDYFDTYLIHWPTGLKVCSYFLSIFIFPLFNIYGKYFPISIITPKLYRMDWVHFYPKIKTVDCYWMMFQQWKLGKQWKIQQIQAL